MFKSRHLKDAFVMMLFIFFVFAAGIRAESSTKPAGDKLLEMIPAESLFCVRVNNFDYTLSQIDQFLTGVSPMPMWLSMMVRGQFAKVLGSPELKAVNMNGSFAIFGVFAAGKPPGPKPSDIFIGVLVPITDYKQFIEGNPNLSQPDPNGISKIISDGMPTMLVTQIGSYALISSGDNYDRLVAMAKSISDAKSAGLTNALDAAEAERAVGEPIWAYGNVQLVSKTFGPLLFSKIEEMKKVMEDMKASGQGPMGDPAEIMNIYVGILELLMKETKSLSITSNLKPSVINITNTVSAVPGTEMADMFTADDSAKQENKLLCYLEDGAVMNVSGKVTGKFNAKAMDFFATIISKNMSAEDTAKIKSFAFDSATVFSGNDAMSFSVDPKNKPPFAMKYVIEIKDKDRFDKVVEEGVKLFNTGGIADFYESIGMKTSFMLERGVENYKGVSIDSAKLIMKSTEPNSPQGQIINAMYGEGFDCRWSIVDGLLVCVTGGDVDSAIRKLIDEVKAGGPKQLAGEMKAALAIIPEASKADFVGTYNFLRWFKIIGAMMPAPAPIPQMDIPTKSNIVFAGKIGQGKMTFEIALPKEHLMEMMGMFQRMQQQQMQQQKQIEGQPTMEQQAG